MNPSSFPNGDPRLDQRPLPPGKDVKIFKIGLNISLDLFMLIYFYNIIKS